MKRSGRLGIPTFSVHSYFLIHNSFAVIPSRGEEYVNPRSFTSREAIKEQCTHRFLPFGRNDIEAAA
jgi:hypothetical protein